MSRCNLKHLFILMSTAGLVSISNNAMAAAFQLWEQDAASVGNYHAGVAAIADDASTNWFNAAGIVRIKNQELVVGIDPVLTDFRFTGTVNNRALFIPAGPQPVTAQGGNYATVPFFHYVAPINNCLAFGLSVGVPFGLKTDYGDEGFVHYSATLTEVEVMDVAPSLAFAVNDKLSLAAGFDWQRLTAELDEFVGAITPANDSFSQNSGSSTGWGYHVGALYQFSPRTRVGLSYRSKVVHHLNGHSTLTGPIANGFEGGVQYSSNFNSSATLPPTTILSIFQTINPCWDILGTVAYTQWSLFKQLTLEGVAGLSPAFVPTNDLVVIIPEHYHNSWNYTIGANYHPNPKWIFRTGIGYDQSPATNTYRNLQLPDSDRIAIAFGAHYQMNKCLGFDAGWTHVFSMNTRINNLSQAFGPEVVTTNGSVKSSADVYGIGVKWDIA